MRMKFFAGIAQETVVLQSQYTVSKKWHFNDCRKFLESVTKLLERLVLKDFCPTKFLADKVLVVPLIAVQQISKQLISKLPVSCLLMMTCYYEQQFCINHCAEFLWDFRQQTYAALAGRLMTQVSPPPVTTDFEPARSCCCGGQIIAIQVGICTYIISSA